MQGCVLKLGALHIGQVKQMKMDDRLITPLDWANIAFQQALKYNELGWGAEYNEQMTHYRRYMALFELIEKLKNETTKGT
jgi:hypothetical protein